MHPVIREKMVVRNKIQIEFLNLERLGVFAAKVIASVDPERMSVIKLKMASIALVAVHDARWRSAVHLANVLTPEE